MSNSKIDLAKLMATLAQSNTETELDRSVERRDLTIAFVSKDGTPTTRLLRVYLPEAASQPMPLIFTAHYEMPASSPELKLYCAKGWAVSTPLNFQNAYNGQLTDDDLVFNSAALTAVRRLPEIDRNRIAIIGGSAGGYMTLMLSALHLGPCCAVSFSGVTNITFNFAAYFEHAQGYNREALLQLSETDRADLMRRIEVMPIPVLGAVGDLFSPIRENFPDLADEARLAAFSPACLTDYFSHPILLTHFTSDVLVPIDQLTRSFTYQTPGESLPAGFRLRLADFDMPKRLSHSLVESLPASDVQEVLVPAPEGNSDVIPAFDLNKRFNITVFDEGSVEAVAGHQKNYGLGKQDASQYIEAQFARSSHQTNWLTPAKLIAMAERYHGSSIQLPAYPGDDPDLYGTLAAHRRAVLEELTDFIENYGRETLAEVSQQVSQSHPERRDRLAEMIKLIDK